MKRTLSSAVLKKKKVGDTSHEDEVDTPIDGSEEVVSLAVAGVKPRLGGSGSAWKAGALSDAEQILHAERKQIVDRILAGRHELRIDPSQIIDVIGTDRREDWRDQEAFTALKESIAKNGHSPTLIRSRPCPSLPRTSGEDPIAR